MVSYKEVAMTEDPYALDGDPSNDDLVTGQWRDPPVNRPEQDLIGVMYETVPVDGDILLLIVSGGYRTVSITNPVRIHPGQEP